MEASTAENGAVLRSTSGQLKLLKFMYAAVFRNRVQTCQEIIVMNVPLFVPDDDGILNCKVFNGVHSPTHVAKVIYCTKDDGSRELWSWMLPNEKSDKNLQLEDYLCELGLIEQHARFEIFADVKHEEGIKINGEIGGNLGELVEMLVFRLLDN
jgi:DNA/RNA endonuclease G (NUC1)